MDNPAVPIPPAPPQTVAPKKFLRLVTGLAILILGIAIGGYFVYQNLPAVRNRRIIEDCIKRGGFIGESYPPACIMPVPTPLSSEISTPGIDPTADWKTYNNDYYGFKFQYLPTDTFEEDQTGGGFQVILNKGTPNEIAVGISPKNIGQRDMFLDTPSRGKTILGENTWLEFYLPQGYQDAGDTNTKSVYALKIAKGDFIYTARIFGSSPTKEQNQILSTFQFLK